MEYDPERGDLVLYQSKVRRVQVGWGLGAVLVFIAIVLVGQWVLNCCGSQGRLEYREHGWWGRGMLNHHIGMMWLQQGQRVTVNYEINFEGDLSRKELYLWFGPAETWSMSWLSAESFKPKHGSKDPMLRSELGGENIHLALGSGSRDYVAQKTGFHILYYDVIDYFSGNVKGDLIVTWQAL